MRRLDSNGSLAWCQTVMSRSASPLVEVKEHMDYLMDASTVANSDISETRQVDSVFNYAQNPLYFTNTFRLSQPEDPGDGTVPSRS